MDLSNFDVKGFTDTLNNLLKGAQDLIDASKTTDLTEDERALFCEQQKELNKLRAETSEANKDLSNILHKFEVNKK